MSEPKCISPLLDNFDIGGPISDHDGVKCCPAMRKNSDEKYIVKIISVPASQTKLDALLLTGAYTSKEAALEYFKELADGIAEEKRILDELAGLEGFISYDDLQIVPMEDATGYDVYLLGEYRMTLDRYTAKSPLTQLAAVNLGLDLCAALASSRRSGYLCIDVKPSNIMLIGEHEYCIGDLGFAAMSSLKYASLPDRYHSAYTAPEVEDAFSALSTTMDIYAIGLVLYQVYNGGNLPFDGRFAPKETFPVPIFADPEMAQIILKACDPDPEQRWQDPAEMGQALVNYMQKNGVSDVALSALIAADEETPESETEQLEMTQPDDETAENDNVSIATEIMAAVSELTNEYMQDETPETAIEEALEETVPLSEDGEETCVAESNENTEICEDIASEEAQEEVQEETDILSILDDADAEQITIDYDSVSDDVSEMLDQIDELTEHEIPEPVVVPDAVEITLPEPIVEQTEEEVPVDDSAEDGNENDTPESQQAAEEITDPAQMPYVPKKKRTGLIWCIVLLLIIALGVGGYFFYQNYYLQPIHALTLDGAEDRLQVQVTSDIDETLLMVVCADSHGNRIPAPVVGGTAIFTGLAPDTAYTVSVEIDGFHQLTGTTSKVYSTPVQTKIAQINAVTGSESGSVILSFAIEGPDSDQWNVIYNADGEAERVTAFPSHMVTLTGLTVGKEYTFRLEPVEEIYLSGDAEIKYVAKELICAENLHISVCSDGVLTAQWDTPANADVTAWTVHCYNENGYDETIVSTENTVTFEGIDDVNGYTVDVTAADMSVNQRVSIGANSITVSNFAVDTSVSGVLTLNWNANRETPAEGWTLYYSVDGINAAQAVTAHGNTAQIPLAGGGEYIFTILDGSGNPVLGGPFAHTQSESGSFDGFSITQSDLSMRLCKTPSASSWSYKDLSDEDYMNSFSVGQKISAVLSLAADTTADDSEVYITYAIYNEDNKLVAFSHDKQSWRSMWYENYCELDVLGIPTEIGTYNLVLLFNGQIAGSQKFAVTS